MKTDIRIRYQGASCVELPSPISVKSGSGARRWLGGSFNKQRKAMKGGMNGLKSSSVQPFNINGNVLVTNSGLWNYLQKGGNRNGDEKEEEIQAFLQKVPLLDITNNKEQKADTSENEKNKDKIVSPKDDTMREVLQAKIFRLQFEPEVPFSLIVFSI